MFWFALSSIFTTCILLTLIDDGIELTRAPRLTCVPSVGSSTPHRGCIRPCLRAAGFFNALNRHLSVSTKYLMLSYDLPSPYWFLCLMPSFSLQANLSCLLLHLVGRRRQEVEARLAHGRRVHHRQGTFHSDDYWVATAAQVKSMGSHQ